MRSISQSADREVVLEDGKPIVSTTDLKGTLTYANSTYIEVSGFADEELRGRKQSSLYHADMPPAVDADMWRTVLSGEPWRGLVKHSSKRWRLLLVYRQRDTSDRKRQNHRLHVGVYQTQAQPDG
jgi:aerotaxis receptor